MKRKISWPLTMCLAGGLIALVGELYGATDDEHGNTISEQYRDAPNWIQHVISFCVGAVCAHLWNWMLTPKPQPNIEVQGVVNVAETKT